MRALEKKLDFTTFEFANNEAVEITLSQVMEIKPLTVINTSLVAMV